MTDNCPAPILDAIPWYPAGLSDDERGAVEAHAANCQACRAELGFVLGSEEPVAPLPDAERIFARVLKRIDEGEELPVPVAEVVTSRWRIERPLAIAASLMVAALAGGLAGFGSYALTTTPIYEVASATLQVPKSSGLASAGQLIDVVFRSDATASEIRDQLNSFEASIVDGPTARGVYRLRLSPGADVGDVVARLEQAGGGIAIFAQPKVD